MKKTVEEGREDFPFWKRILTGYEGRYVKIVEGCNKEIEIHSGYISRPGMKYEVLFSSIIIALSAGLIVALDYGENLIAVILFSCMIACGSFAYISGMLHRIKLYRLKNNCTGWIKNRKKKKNYS
jgi:hypothetical protein